MSADEGEDVPLSLGEEILLLLVDGDTGDLRPIPPWSLACALSGATLMELSMLGRLDTDQRNLYLIDETTTGNALLDSVVAEIGGGEQRSTRFWLERFAARSNELREAYLDMLADRGIALAGREEWLDPSPGQARGRERGRVDLDAACGRIRLRVARCLLTAEIPDGREVMTVSLADACGLFVRLLTRTELESAQPRIALMRQMDQIGRAITDAIWELEPPVARRRERTGKPIPEVPGLPLVGNGLSIARDASGFLLQQYRRYGPVFRVRFPGRRYVVLAGLEANRLAQRRGKDLLRSDFPWHGFAAGFGASRMMLGMDGREHMRLRRAHKNGYSRALLNERIPDLVRIVRTHVQGWGSSPLHVVSSMRRIVTEQIGTIVAGFSPREYVDDLSRVVRALLLARIVGVAPEVLLWTRTFRRARARSREMVERLWSAHLERPAHMRRDIVDDLLELHAEDPQFLPETDLYVALLGPFIAGLDTVTAAVSFALHELLTHPDLMGEATREADEAFADGTPTAERIDALDVTRRVVLESLRLHPVSPFTLRRAVNTFEFGGHVVPAGQELMLAFALPHRLSEVYPCPERFDIGRFAPDRGEHRVLGGYCPFGLGPHRCLGAGLAEQQVVATVAAVLRHSRLAPHPPDYRLRVRQFPVAIPDDRFRMRATPRR